MTKRINFPGWVIIDFPESTSNEEIQRQFDRSQKIHEHKKYLNKKYWDIPSDEKFQEEVGYINSIF